MTATGDGGPAPDRPIRVVLADDQDLVRTGIALVIDSQPDLRVVAQARDGEQAVALATRHDPDIVVMDVRMPRLDGVEATRRIADSGTSAKVIVLTMDETNECVVRALRAGASGFLLKDAPAEDLLAALRVVHRGDAVIDPRTTRRLLADFATAAGGDATARAVGAGLTEREREIWRAVATGMSNAEIAAEFVIVEATVKSHVSRLLSKLGLRDRVQAVVLAYESGLIRPGQQD